MNRNAVVSSTFVMQIFDFKNKRNVLLMKSIEYTKKLGKDICTKWLGKTMSQNTATNELEKLSKLSSAQAGQLF